MYGYAQTGILAGKVTTNNKALELATVRLEADTLVKGTTTDVEGKYRLEDIPAGSYTLHIQRLGYKTFTETVEIQSGGTTTREVELKADWLNLEQVVVSATRYELDRKEAPIIVNVTDEKLFNATQSMALSETLNFTPGVRVETNCQNCGFTQVRLNGLQGGYTQILVNSRPVFSALNSVYGLDQIPTSIIKRVEVVRGGGSALYGSNAIAGTVNIITQDPIDNSWQVSTNFAQIDGATPDNSVNFNASLVNDDLTSGLTVHGMFRNRGGFDANGDGFTEITRLENNTFGAKAFLRPGKYSKITLDFNAIKEYRRGGDRLDLAPHFTDITEELDHNTLIGGVTYEQFSKDRRNKFSAYVSGQRTQRDSYYGGLGGGRTAEDSTLAINAYGNTEDLAIVGGVQYSHTFSSRDVLVLGLENQFSDVADDIPGYNRLVDQQVNTIGFFGQYEWKPCERFKALIGGRYDYTTVDGRYEIGNVQRSAEVGIGVFSPRITLMYDLMDNLQLRGGYARGFRAPQAFNEDLHISSVGGEPQFVILADGLDKELSEAYTASLSYNRVFGIIQTNILVEGFYTDLKDPFIIVSTGSVLPNGSILEEVRNGAGASVAGSNFELGVSPSADLQFQLGGTLQRSVYEEDQVLFEPEPGNELESTVVTDEFVRNPNLYGYLAANWQASDHWKIDVTGAYTGAMTVPRVVGPSGLLDLVESDPFVDVNFKLSHHIDIRERFHLELSGGVQNAFNAYQDDFDTGPRRDSDYVYGPARPRTYFLGVKIGDFH